MKSQLIIDGRPFDFDGNISRIEFDPDIPNYITDIHTPMSASGEFNMECTVNVPLMKKLLGRDICSGLDVERLTLIGSIPHKVQRRKHKKKRINKKWAKRYGYVTAMEDIKFTDAQFSRGGDEFEVTGVYSGGIIK